MRTTLPTFLPTTAHAGPSSGIHNMIMRTDLGSVATAVCTSDPKSGDNSGTLGTTADYGRLVGHGPGPRSPLNSTPRYTVPVSRGTRPNSGHGGDDDRLYRPLGQQATGIAVPLARSAWDQQRGARISAGIRSESEPKPFLS